MDEKQENELDFGEFLAARMRDHGITMKRLAEATGIAPNHLENLVHGNFDEMPSVPYFHGYLVRIAKVLDFDGEAWWTKLRDGNFVKNSGPADALPHNRFIKKKMPKSYWIAGIVIIVLVIYLAISFPRITGTPTLTVSYPNQTPFVTAADTFALQGTVKNADALYLSNGATSSSEEIAINPDGTWQENVLLQSGLNSFEITAKKLLGGTANVTEEIVYQAPAATSSSATSTPGTTSTSITSPASSSF